MVARPQADDHEPARPDLPAHVHGGPARTGLADADLGTRLAAALILLATGALGSAVQFSVSSQAIAIARDLRDASATSHAARTVIAAEGLTNLIRYAIPALFVVIYVVILVALFS